MIVKTFTKTRMQTWRAPFNYVKFIEAVYTVYTEYVERPTFSRPGDY